MSTVRTTCLALAVCLASLSACGSPKKNPGAPNPGGTPSGIMSAVVNSLAWSAGGSTWSPAAADYDAGAGSILIVGYRYYADGSGSNVLIHVEQFTGIGTYTLRTGALTGARAIFASYTAALDTTKFATDAGNTGTLTVETLDTTNRTVTGKFNFTGYHAASTTTTAVTSGSFDVSY